MLRPDIDLREQNGHHELSTIRFRTIAQILDAVKFIADIFTSHESYPAGTGAWGRQACAGALPRAWAGTDTAAEYIDMLENGWPTGVKDLTGLDGLTADSPLKLQFQRSVAGAFPLVPEFLAGSPTSMLMPHQMPQESIRGTTLVVDAAFSCGVTADEVLAYATSIMKLVAWLQAERIETAVYAVVSLLPTSYAKRRYTYVVPVLPSGQIFQAERIAAILHPSFLRRGILSMVGQEAFLDAEKGGQRFKGSRTICKNSYGSPLTPTTSELLAGIPEVYSAVLLPKVGEGDPAKAVEESLSLRLQEEA